MMQTIKAACYLLVNTCNVLRFEYMIGWNYHAPRIIVYNFTSHFISCYSTQWWSWSWQLGRFGSSSNVMPDPFLRLKDKFYPNKIEREGALFASLPDDGKCISDGEMDNERVIFQNRDWNYIRDCTLFRAILYDLVGIFFVTGIVVWRFFLVLQTQIKMPRWWNW